MRFLLLSCLIMLSFSPAKSFGFAPNDDTGLAVAKAVQRLSSSGRIADIHALAIELKIPNLIDKMKRSAPMNNYSGLDFGAWFRPEQSDFGIEVVSQTWQFRIGRDDMFYNLRVVLSATHCPTMETMERAMGVKVVNFLQPLPHGGYPPITVNSFNFDDAPGGSVGVFFDNESGCVISASQSRKIR